ncbi:Sulfite exporter TauE/SafE family protein 4 [Vitis vinifera]|uniref:Sulfite exporter TauE/SafE family protein 4 n=1 Tax=Vitis vinifera TaxID=29760 RepID=A0A438EKB4_VITVI|nr:Sulfite exporter TauE/SafE family protein 4 [Vitis vinifera]
MATRGLVLYLLSGFSVAVLSVFFFTDPNGNHTYPPSNLSSLNTTLLQNPFPSVSSSSEKVWPELKFSWRIVLATVIGFLGSAFGTVGGVGGGGIFVPMLTLIVGFDTKSAAALSKCMIMGASTSSVWYNLRVNHPTKEAPIIDYDLALLFQPMLMLGITVGVALSVVFPYWLITILIIILFMGTSTRSFFKAVQMWNEETLFKKELEEQRRTMVNSHGELLIDAEYDPLIPTRKNHGLSSRQNDSTVCSAWYWVLFLLQFPVAVVVFGYGAVKLHKEYKKRIISGNTEAVCEANIEWTELNLAFCALCGILGALLEVASATATFVMMFSSSLSVVEFYLLKRFPIPYALYLISVSVVAGFWGQLFIRKLVAFLRRASIIIFILSGVIFASALTMGWLTGKLSVSVILSQELLGPKRASL